MPEYSLPVTEPEYAIQRTAYSIKFTAEQKAPVLEKLNLNGVIKVTKDDEYIDLLSSRKMLNAILKVGKNANKY